MSEVKRVKQDKLTFYFGVEQGTQEWLDLRANRATCSNAGLLVDKGINAAIEANRQHANRNTVNGNQYAERGHVLEDEIQELLKEHFESCGFKILTCSFITHEDYEHAGYSPDGIIVNQDGKFVAPLEVKCFNDVTERYDPKTYRKYKYWSWKHKKACADWKTIPFQNRMQFQMEMLMTDTRELILVLYNPDAVEGVPKLKIHHVDRNDEYCEVIRERLLEPVTLELI